MENEVSLLLCDHGEVDRRNPHEILRDETHSLFGAILVAKQRDLRSNRCTRAHMVFSLSQFHCLKLLSPIIVSICLTSRELMKCFPQEGV